MSRGLWSNHVAAVLVVLVLVGSALVPLVAVLPSRAASSTTAPLLFDDFANDTAINPGLWQINGPVGMQFGQDEVGVNVVTLVPAFSSKGMMIDQINGSQQEGTIESLANFTPPFSAMATVEGTVSNGHTFGFAITSADASSGVTVYGNLNPQNCSHLGDCGDPSVCGTSANSAIPPNQCYYGIDAKVGSNGSSWKGQGKLYRTPSVNVTYTVLISVESTGEAWYAVSQAGQVLGWGTQYVGTGPFWLIMYQGEGSPVEAPGPNQAYWMSASVTPVATTFSTTSTLSTTSSIASSVSTTTPAVPTTSGIPVFIWLIIIIVIVILLLIILLWLRRRNLTIRTQDAQTQSPVVEALASAEGPEKLKGYTDNEGKITFKGVKKGDYSIKAEAKGYVTSTPVKIEIKKTTEYTVKLDRLAAGVQGGAGANAPPPGPGPQVMAPVETKPAPQESGAVAPIPSPQPQQPRPSVAQPVPQVPPPAAPQPAPAPSPSSEEELEEGGGLGGRIGEIIKTFQAKGAISPETALTADELGLSRIFVRIMKRRRGRTRIFVEINGRYYLDQKALKEMA